MFFFLILSRDVVVLWAEVLVLLMDLLVIVLQQDLFKCPPVFFF